MTEPTSNSVTTKPDTQTREHTGQMSKLLNKLLDLGFSWNDIARVAGVSIPDMRKRHDGEQVTETQRKQVTAFVAFCQLAQDEHMVDDVASWMETPLHADTPLTILDIVAEGRYDLAIQHASAQGAHPERVLDLFDPEWRERYTSAVEVFTAPDGLPGIRFTEEAGANADTGRATQ